MESGQLEAGIKFENQQGIPKQSQFSSLLTMAIWYRAPRQIIERFIDNGAPVDNNAFMTSVVFNRPDFLQIMYERGVELNRFYGLNTLYDFALTGKLFSFAGDGSSVQSMFQLLKSYGVNPNLSYRKGEDILTTALQMNDGESVELLIEGGSFVDSSHLKIAANGFSDLLEAHLCE